ncbi:hypothetical protein BpHYR1_053205 [Brachionus plicatilis]|uniref:Uncharacterized protein n=1 Tax=Brachionus plicatilis TaxID=10195 RepID=A0A3M7PVK8_BRAPC|nr:hypothetical protein BpHYR1_053205 [Brachionus plicatilis]
MNVVRFQMFFKFNNLNSISTRVDRKKIRVDSGQNMPNTNKLIKLEKIALIIFLILFESKRALLVWNNLNID